jgi:hypothetical protein
MGAGRSRADQLGQILAGIAAFLALGFATWVALSVGIVLEADSLPQCPELQPNNTLLFLIGFGSVALAISSLVASFKYWRWTYALVAGQVPLGLAWYAADGGAAGCLIG